MENNYRHYWDDIKKNFIVYSLVPALVIVLIGYPVIYLSFMNTLFRNNEKANMKISGEIDTTIRQYSAVVDELVNLQDLQMMLKNKKNVPKEEIYEEIYSRLRETTLLPNCFVLNVDGEILLSTTTRTPDYICRGIFSQIGIGQRMKAQAGSVVVKRCAFRWEKEYSLCVGRAVEESGETAGFVILDLPGTSMMQLLRESTSSASIVTNQFGYPFAGEVSDSLLQHNKLAEPLRSGTGKVRIGERTQYVSATKLMDGQICVYTIMDVSYLDKMFIHVGLLLLAAETVFTVLLLRSSQRFARRKSKIMDDMVTAVRNVQKGELNTKLEVSSQDELQIFAEEYNRMLTELTELMKVNEEVVRQTVITEIKQLESQFNPHFLYNTLGTIKYMIYLNREGASRMIDDLSEILRYNIRTTASQSRFEEDLQYTRNYLDILQYRFEEALQYTLEIEDETLDCLVPKLVIQPIIENAINYGMHSRMHITIEISAKLENGLLLLVVKNDGEGMTQERLAEVRDQLNHEHTTDRRIGLYNIHRRIQLLYGNAYGIQIESSPETGTEVVIEFPAKRGEVL